MKTMKLHVPVLALVLAGLLGGCAATAPFEAGTKLDEMLAAAAAASSAGKSEQAISALQAAAGAFPAAKEPWREMAQMHFDSGNYGPAISSAQEVLQRDPEDQLASSIIAVSGLRISTRALADLSRQNHLSGSLRTEAEGLAKLLRETLGEPVLVPARARAAATPARPVVVAQPARRRAANPAPETSGGNPFGSLK